MCFILFLLYLFPPSGVLVCVFCVVAVQGGFAAWSLSVLSVCMVVCLVITFIIWRQPESKAKLAFKVKFAVALASECVFHTGLRLQWHIWRCQDVMNIMWKLHCRAQ